MNPTPAQSPSSSSARRSQVFVALLLLVVGPLLCWLLLKSGPRARERTPGPQSILVEVRPVVLAAEEARVEAFGTVIPARQVEMRAQVSGEVVWLSEHLLPGSMVQAGEELLAIEQADHLLAVREATGKVAEAEATLRLEEGYREVARRDYEASGEQVEGESLDLVLRAPQYDSALASLEAARARLARAQLDLARTRVHAPFPAVVQKKEVDLGSRLAVNSPLFTLVGADCFWIEALVPVAQLAWLTIPEKEGRRGSPVRVHDPAWGEGVFRKGRVLRVAAELEEQGRLARLLVAVEDPLGLAGGKGAQARLFVGSYVRLEIEGKPLASVAPVERALLRDGDQVWLLNGSGELEIRPVEVAFRGRERVLVSRGLEAGELLVMTDLAAPVPGMKLRTADGQEEAGGKIGEEPAGAAADRKGGGR